MILLLNYVLDGQNNYQNFIIQLKTVLEESEENWEFGASDYNNNGKYEFYCFHKQNTESNHIESQVHELMSHLIYFLKFK